jgi:hypothetical protein
MATVPLSRPGCTATRWTRFWSSSVATWKRAPKKAPDRDREPPRRLLGESPALGLHLRQVSPQPEQATREGPSSPLQPKPEESNATIVAAIKAALDEGRHERAAALHELLRRTDRGGRVVVLRTVGGPLRE